MRELIEKHFGKSVEISYRTINLGNGSDSEQEEAILQGEFNGQSDTNGRTIRYAFEPADGSPTLYLFEDEVLDLARFQLIRCDQCEAAMINGVFCHETRCVNSKKTYEDGEWVRYVKCFECGCEVLEGEFCCNDEVGE